MAARRLHAPSGATVRPGQTGRRAEAALAEITLVEGLGTIDDVKIDLEDYQVVFMLASSRFRLVEKARQTGFSWIFAAEAVARAHLRPTYTANFVSYNLDDAKEKIRYAKMIAESLPLSFRKPMVEDAKTHLGFLDKATRQTALLRSHPSRAPRGKGGDIYLDELAHYQADQEVYKGSAALIARHPLAQLTVCSTPAGRRGVFWEIARQETEKTYPGYHRQRVPWWLSRHYCRDVAAAMKAGIGNLPTASRVEAWGTPAIVEQFDSLLLEDFQQEMECFRPGTLILTDRGPEPIERILVGDVVRTHRGRVHAVTGTSARPYRGPLVEITTHHTNMPLCATPNHPLLTVRFPRCRYGSRKRAYPWSSATCPDRPRMMPKPAFRRADQIGEQDVLLYPIQKPTASAPRRVRIADHFTIPPGFKSKNHIPEIVTLDRDMLRLAGYFLAEGSISGAASRIVFCFGAHERRYATRVRAAIRRVFGMKSDECLVKSSRIVGVNSVVVAGLFADLFGRKQEARAIPDPWLNLPIGRLRVLLDAYIDGEGFRRPDQEGCSTISRKLAYQVRDLYARAGAVPSIRSVGTKPVRGEIGGRHVWVKPHHEVRIFHRATEDPRGVRGWNDGRYLYLPVRGVRRRSYRGPVYNLQVAGDQSYVAGSHAVHNCEFVDEAHSFFPWELILPAAKDITLHTDFHDWTVSGRLVAGYDVGRKRDLAALVITETIEDQEFVRLCQGWARRPFEEQMASLCEMLDVLPIAVLHIDPSGIGMQLAEALVNKYGAHRVRADAFTLQSKEMWATDLKIKMERHQLTLPKNRDLLTQMHAIRKTVGAGGKPQFDSERNARHHGDLFWALALATQRERTGVAKPTLWTVRVIG